MDRASLMNIVKTMQPDGAATALYFLDIPRLVWSKRNSMDSSEGQEIFPIRSELEQICRKEDLIVICRALIDHEGTEGFVYGLRHNNK